MGLFLKDLVSKISYKYLAIFKILTFEVKTAVAHFGGENRANFILSSGHTGKHLDTNSPARPYFSYSLLFDSMMTDGSSLLIVSPVTVNPRSRESPFTFIH